MKPQHEFIAERRAAIHCEQLAARIEEPSGGLGAFARFGQALAPAMAARLGAVFAEGQWEAVADAPEALPEMRLAERIDPVAGNFLLPAGDAGGRLCASFRLPPVMERLETMFGGGSGSRQFEPGAKLPNSLVMVLHKLERALTGAVIACLDETVERDGQKADFAADFGKLAVFSGQAEAVVLPLRFVSERFAPIEVQLVCHKATMNRLLAHFRGETRQTERTAPDTVPAAMEDIALPLRARLTEMKMPASRLMALKPGQTLPLAVARSVPLLAGGRALASGVIGEQDDRVALQIDRVMLSGGIS